MATYVLVHGSYQGGWIWKEVAARLRAAGHEVYAPTLDGCGERKEQVRPGITTETQADEVAQLLFYEDLHDVVLVGTSSGGMVVCRVAELIRDRIAPACLRRRAGAAPRREDPRHRHPLDRGRRRASSPGRPARTPRTACSPTSNPRPAPGRWSAIRSTRPASTTSPVKLDSFWSIAVEGERHLVHAAPEPRRGAPAPHRRKARRQLCRARHRPLPDAEHAGGTDRDAGVGFPRPALTSSSHPGPPRSRRGRCRRPANTGRNRRAGRGCGSGRAGPTGRPAPSFA